MSTALTEASSSAHGLVLSPRCREIVSEAAANRSCARIALHPTTIQNTAETIAATMPKNARDETIFDSIIRLDSMFPL